VIRPDGIDVAIASSGIDNLGRAGATGDVDNHVMRNLSTAIMISVLDIGAATYLDKNGGKASGTTSTITGGVTNNENSQTGTIVTPTITTGTPPTNTQGAAGQTIANIEEVGKKLLAKTLAMPPTITIDQGTQLKVYVQKDIIFPGRSANLARIIE
jgi:type IV secretion system protein VirB10